MAHVAKWKFGEIDELSNLITCNRVIGILEIGGIPAPQMQKMRKDLHGNALVRSAKNKLIFRALDEAEKKVKGINALKEVVIGQSAIIATDMNPFKLYAQIKGTRTMAPAKGGEIAAYDIEVKEGDTSFKPGPIVGELQKVGIPAAIQEGKVIIKSDKIVVPAGEKIPVDTAQMLTRLEIFPIEIGLSLHAVYEEGEIFRPDVLDIDLDEFRSKIHNASGYAFNLAIESAWINNLTIKPLLQKAFNNSFNLALEKGILNKETIKNIISKAHSSMLSLSSNIKDGLDDDLKNMVT